MLRLSNSLLARRASSRGGVHVYARNKLRAVAASDQQTRFLSSLPPAKNGVDKLNADPEGMSSLTPEELHNLRMEAQRSAKALKRLEHQEKVKGDHALAEAKKRVNVRKNAARAVAHLLGTDMTLFHNVLEELNLTTSSSYDANRTKGSWMEYRENSMTAEGKDAFAHYRAIYLDSIPSFAQILVNNPASVDRIRKNDELSVNAAERGSSTSHEEIASKVEEHGNQEEGTSKAEQVLDELSAVGFSDLKWAKQHQQVRKKKEDSARHLKLLHRKTTELKEVQEEIIALQAKLEFLETSIASTNTDQGTPETPRTLSHAAGNRHTNIEESASSGGAEEATETNALKSVLDKVVGLFQNLHPVPEQNETTLQGKQDQKLRRQNAKRLRRVEKLRSIVAHAEKRKLGLSKQLDKLKVEYARYKPALSDAEYDAANKAAQRVLSELCPAFAAHMHTRHAKMIEQYRILDAQTDLTKPHEWYPRTRLNRRKIIFHGGPTNSGKTYTALQRLKYAGRGLYLAPLRLLAAEVYEKLTSQGVYTNLLTGQEKRTIPFSTHSSATVEMSPLDEEFDVVVIDEIQMISDPFRGFAWTRALLGIQCKEIHVCGGLEALDLVKKIAEVCGDELEVHTYTRFSELTVADKSLSDSSNASGSYEAVQPGDCVVAFSRNDIFGIKREIERKTDHKCCVIYGTLPPQTRTDQARRFNDPNSGYDVLVASDAIGMGLNLNIKRIIFNSIFKSNGEEIVRLDHSSLKQIAGRAGRRNSPFPNGEVTCRDPADMDFIRKCMGTEIPPIERAGLIPTAEHFELFSVAAEKYDICDDVLDIRNNLHRVIRQFSEMARMKGDFFMCRRSHMQLVAEWMDEIHAEMPLSISDKYMFCMSPVNERCKRSSGLLKSFARKHAFGEVFGLNTRNFTPKQARSFEDLSSLCSMHHELELFLWLSARFPGNAVEQMTAELLKEKTIDLINQGLMQTETLHLNHNYINRDRTLRRTWANSQKDAVDVEDVHDFVHHMDEDDDVLEHVEVDDI